MVIAGVNIVACLARSSPDGGLATVGIFAVLHGWKLLCLSASLPTCYVFGAQSHVVVKRKNLADA